MNQAESESAYRRLYEGSLASLGDMASKHEATHRRVEALRRGVLETIKQHFPAECAEAENRLGTQLGNASDEVLLAYLSGFMSKPLERTAARESLVSDNMGLLRKALEDSGVELPASEDPKDWADAIRRQADRKPEPVPQAPTMRAPLQEPVEAEAPIVVSHDLLEDLFGSEPVDFEEPPDGLYDLFEEDYHTEPARVEELPGEEEEDLFSDGQEFNPGLSVLDLVDPALLGAEVAEEPVQMEEETRTEPAELPEQEEPEPQEVRIKAGTQLGLPGADHVKPEIVPLPPRPAAKKSRSKKETRVSASRPEEAPTSTVEVLDKVLVPHPVFTSDLTAQGLSPEAVASWEQDCRNLGTGSPVRFLTPRTRHRERGNLILPHEKINDGRFASWSQTPWGKAVADSRLRQTRMYELAVLIHRNKEAVKSITVGEHAVILRLVASRGLVGVVFITDDELEPGGSSRAGLSDAVEELLAERTTLIVVATSAVDGMSRVAQVLQEESRERSWKVSVPVVCDQSWLYKADGSSTTLEALP